MFKTGLTVNVHLDENYDKNEFEFLEERFFSLNENNNPKILLEIALDSTFSAELLDVDWKLIYIDQSGITIRPETMKSNMVFIPMNKVDCINQL